MPRSHHRQPRRRSRVSHQRLPDDDAMWDNALSLMETFTREQKFRCDIPPPEQIEGYSVMAYWNGTSHPRMLAGKAIKQLLPQWEKTLREMLTSGTKLGDIIADARQTLDGIESNLIQVVGYQGNEGSAKSRQEAILEITTLLGTDMSVNEWYWSIWVLHRTKQLKPNDDRFGWLFITNSIAKRMEGRMGEWNARPTKAEFDEATRRIHARYPLGVHPYVSGEDLGCLHRDIPSRPDL